MSIGTDLDPRENARAFLQKLLDRKNYTFASIWVRHELLRQAEPGFHLLFARPRFHIGEQLLPSQPKVLQVMEQGPQAIEQDMPIFSLFCQEHLPPGQGYYLLFPLDGVGFLKIYEGRLRETPSLKELHQLKAVTQKLGHALAASFSHQHYKTALAEKSAFAEALQNERADLQGILRVAREGVVTADGQGHILRWNPQAEKMFGWTASEIQGKPFIQTLIAEEERSALQEALSAFNQQHVVAGFDGFLEIKALRKNGTHFPAEISIVSVEKQGGFFFSAFIKDISERKEAEAQQASLLQQLQSANQELRDFTYAASHDLKTPLRAISSLTHWLKEDLGEALDEAGLENFIYLEDRIDRMYKIIEGIITYANIGRKAQSFTHQAIRPWVEQSINRLSVPPGIEITLDEELPALTVHGPSLEEAFFHLIQNAIQHRETPTGKIHISSREEGRHCILEVQDDGLGISPAYQEKIFNIFQTLKPKDKKASLGLGLPIVRKIVQRHQGSLSVASTPGKGSRFTITLEKEEEV
ncbi:MAG: ATP-binding protein [Bacteroidota bacterium]